MPLPPPTATWSGVTGSKRGELFRDAGAAPRATEAAFSRVFTTGQHTPEILPELGGRREEGLV